MYVPRKVTFVENLPPMDELESASHKRIIENYEHSSPPPPPGKKLGPYTLYENIYGGDQKIPPPSRLSNFNDESSSKDLLLNKAIQKLPSRLEGGNLSMPMPQQQQHHRPELPSSPPPPALYEEPKFFVPEYHQNQSYIIYENTKIPTYSSTSNTFSPPPPLRRPHSHYRRPPQQPLYPLRHRRPIPSSPHPSPQQQSLCSAINEHISSCSLCNNLYITTIKSKCKPQSRSMSTVIFVIIILILSIICFIMLKKLWKQGGAV